MMTMTEQRTRRTTECTLANVDRCELTHPGCAAMGECQGHSSQACHEAARYVLSGPNLRQYACRDHIDLMLRRHPGASVEVSK